MAVLCLQKPLPPKNCAYSVVYTSHSTLVESSTEWECWEWVVERECSDVQGYFHICLWQASTVHRETCIINVCCDDLEINYQCWIPNTVFSIWSWAFNCREDSGGDMSCYSYTSTPTVCPNSIWRKVKGDSWRLWDVLGLSSSCRGHWRITCTHNTTWRKCFWLL